MIRHCVFLRLRPGADVTGVLAELATLSARLPGASGFAAGPNIDAEGKSPDHPVGFTIDFADRAALDRYAADPDHQKLGAELVAACIGGAAGIVVYDLEVPG